MHRSLGELIEELITEKIEQFSSNVMCQAKQEKCKELQLKINEAAALCSHVRTE